MGTLKIKSPCYDSALVSVSGSDAPDYLYYLSPDNDTPTDFFTFTDAVVTDLTGTTPNYVSTCELTRAISYDIDSANSDVTTISNPLSLLSAESTTFQIFSEDSALVNTAVDYRIKYCFTQNTAECDASVGTITFLDVDCVVQDPGTVIQDGPFDLECDDFVDPADTFGCDGGESIQWLAAIPAQIVYDVDLQDTAGNSFIELHPDTVPACVVEDINGNPIPGV